MAQRVRALNAFVADVYGPQKIVADGVVPSYVIESASYYEPGMRGVKPHSGVWIGVAGLDVVRDHEGRWMVLEDNCRTPSGFAYLHAARRALLSHLPIPPDANPRPLDGEIDLLADALRTAAPEGSAGHHSPVRGAADRRRAQLGLLGARLAGPLAAHPAGRARGPVGPRRPAVRFDRRRAVARRRRLPAHQRGPARVRRRRAADRPDPRGTLGLINQYGSGVADDKLTHAYVEDMIRYYVGEEPVLPSVPTYDLAQPDQLERALDIFETLVIKPRMGHGGVGVLIAPARRA